MSNETIEEFDAFIKKIRASQPLQIKTQVDEQVYKHLYREVVLAIAPIVEELRERLNLVTLYHDSKKNPSHYTEAERGHLDVLYEALVEDQKELLKKRGPFDE